MLLGATSTIQEPVLTIDVDGFAAKFANAITSWTVGWSCRGTDCTALRGCTGLCAAGVVSTACIRAHRVSEVVLHPWKHVCPGWKSLTAALAGRAGWLVLLKTPLRENTLQTVRDCRDAAFRGGNTPRFFICMSVPWQARC